MDTKLFVRKASGGMFAVIDKSLTTGNIWWVDSGSTTGADTAGYGKNPDSPFLTLDFAIGQTTANNGDIIYVMPGHAETYSTTGAKNVFDQAGVKVIGLGSGADRPTFTFSHTGATQTISAASVWLENLLFVTGVDSVTTLGTISGADCILKDIESRDAAGVEVITDWTVTGDRLKVYNYFKNGDLASGDANVRVFSLNGVDGAYFDPACRFITKVTTAVIGTVSNACTGLVADGCVFEVSGTTNFLKDVVDGATGSDWLVHGYDIGAGASFSGGSGGTPAGDDIGAVSSGVSTVSSIVTTISAGISTVNSIATKTSSGVSTADSKIVSVATVAGATSAGVSTNTSIVTTASAGVSTVNSIVTTASAGISTADSKIVSVATVAGATSAGVSTVNSIATTISAGVSTADSKIVSVATVTGATSAGVSTNTSIVTTASAGISTNTSIVTTISAGVSTADSRLISVATVAGNTSAGVSTNTSIVTTASAGVSTVNSIVTTISAGVSTNASIVTTISAGVSTNTSTLTVLNAWDVRTVSKAGIALDAGTVNSVFTVAGGPVECLGLILLITTAVSANNCTMKWQNDPDLAVAATTDLCSTVDLISAAIGDMFATVGASGSAAVKYASGTATALMNATNALIQAGAVNLVLSNADPTTGAGTAYLVYRPLVSGATVTAP